MNPYLHLLDRSLGRTKHDADVIPLARSTVQVLRDDLAELDTARARIAELEPAVHALLKDLAHREQGDPPYDPALVDAVLAALARKD